jgi:hypothetical protein
MMPRRSNALLVIVFPDYQDAFSQFVITSGEVVIPAGIAGI